MSLSNLENIRRYSPTPLQQRTFLNSLSLSKVLFTSLPNLLKLTNFSKFPISTNRQQVTFAPQCSPPLSKVLFTSLPNLLKLTNFSKFPISTNRKQATLTPQCSPSPQQSPVLPHPLISLNSLISLNYQSPPTANRRL